MTGSLNICQSTPSARKIFSVLLVSFKFLGEGLVTSRFDFYFYLPEFVYMANALPNFDMPAAAKLTKFLKEQDERKPAFKKAVAKAIDGLSELVVSLAGMSIGLVITY